jgi:cell division protein FtsQ
MRLIHRKDNRKRIPRNLRRRLVIGGACLLLCAIAIAGYRWRAPIRSAAGAARGFIIDNPYFAVREIQVRGGKTIGGSEIVAMAGLRHGMNMWRLEPSVIEGRIARHAAVRRVIVRREFPRRVVIDVEERIPKAIVAAGKLYYMDADGVPFREVAKGENIRFPLLTGLRSDQLSSSNRAMRQKIQDAMRLGELMTQDSHVLSEIHFDSAERVVLYTTSYPVALHMGWGDWEDKIKRLDRVLGFWKGHEERLSSLDVSFTDQVVAKVNSVKQ